MNDALMLLRAADPARDTTSYPETERALCVARAMRDGSDQVLDVNAAPSSARRRTGIVVASSVAATLTVGLGTAAATVWVGLDARNAFRGASDPASSEQVNPDAIERELGGPGPEGALVTGYGAPAGPQGFCALTIVDRKGADIVPGKPGGPGGGCSSQRRTGTLQTVDRTHWISPQTGVSHHRYAGPLGTAAAAAKIRVDGQPVVAGIEGNGFFLAGPITEAQKSHATLVATDRNGQVPPVFGRPGQSLADQDNPG